MVARRVATNPAVEPHDTYLTDSSRTALAVTDRQRLWLLDADDLRVRHRWELGQDATGRHGARAADQMALVSGLGEVTLLDARGNRSWGFAHPPWSPGGGLQSGCAWFDDGGEAFALVPATDEDGLCEVVHLSGRDGTLAVAREIDPPEGLHWDYYACFAGDHVVARALDYAEVELLVAVDRENRRTQLEPVPHSLSPGPAGSWFTAREQGIERWALGDA